MLIMLREEHEITTLARHRAQRKIDKKAKKLD